MTPLPAAALLVVAGGTGSRMGANMPKQFLPVRAGQSVLQTTLLHCLGAPLWQQVVVVAHPDWLEHCRHELSAPALQPLLQPVKLTLAPGGSSRTRSVFNGLQALQRPLPEVVAIHDAVRPFVTHHQLRLALLAAHLYGAAVTAVPVKSSMRQRTPEGSRALDRSAFYHVQTPQCFKLVPLLQRYQAAVERNEDFTDDASLWEAAGGHVHLVEGSYDNLKITTPEDLELARLMLHRWQPWA